MIPVVAIVGISESGKTTLIERLIRELKARGYQVATIKHATHDLVLDREGKDSWRHIQAGSKATAVSSAGEFALIRPIKEELNVNEIAHLLGEDYDIVLAEGFKQSDTPKIEVHRKEVGPPLGSLRKLVAIVTDEPLETKVRQFDFEDIGELADLLEKGFIRPQKERLSVYVNNKPVALMGFPVAILSNVIVAMLSCLKGIDVEGTESIEIFLKKEPKL
jgi:molybdopterin-guanine dinucleotide biosynthesis adapter protein